MFLFSQTKTTAFNEESYSTLADFARAALAATQSIGAKAWLGDVRTTRLGIRKIKQRPAVSPEKEDSDGIGLAVEDLL